MGPLIMWLRTFFASRYGERGATAVEYGLIVAAIAAVIVIIVFTLGTQIQTAFQTVSDEIGGFIE